MAVIAALIYKPTVQIATTTPEATIYVDDMVYSAPIKVTPGKHTIAIRAAGFVPYSYTNPIKAFSTLNLSIALRLMPTTQTMVNDQAFAADFTTDGKTFYYLGNSGKTLFKLTLVPDVTDTSKLSFATTRISPDNLPLLKKVVFAPDFSVAIFKQQDGDTGLYDFKQYNLLNQEYTSWGQNIGNVAWDPSGNRVMYYLANPTGERLLMMSDRTHKNVTMVKDLKTEAGITASVNDNDAPQLSWSQDGKAVLVVVQGKLLLLNIATNTLTVVPVSGVSAGQFAPDSHHLLYTQNNKLVWQQFELVNALSGQAQDQIDVGKIRVGPAQSIDLTASAVQGIFTRNTQNPHFIIITKDGIKDIDLNQNFVKPFYLKDDPRLANISALGLSGDGHLLYGFTGDTILAIPLDSGDYSNQSNN